MELTGKKIEFDLEEFVPLLLSNKQEGFRLIGERFLNTVMEKEFEAFIGAGKHERSKERVDYRNGHKERQLKTTLGELNLLRPYARSGRFETKLFENYSRIDKALASIIVEGYLKGISTRKVEGVLSELDIELSHTTVSNLSYELDELITEFRTSPLKKYYPYLYVDALYLKVFNGSRFVSQALSDVGCTPNRYAVSEMVYPFSTTCLTASILNSSLYLFLDICNSVTSSNTSVLL